MKKFVIIIILLLLSGCVEIQVVKKNNTMIIPLYPDPRSDFRFFNTGDYPYPISF